MSSPGMVFIVGMERCFTTSLAQWLVDAGLCDGFVEGIKEPAMFSSDPSRALARWERERGRHDRWLLDASVGYAWSDEALDAIATLPDYRVVLCLRDQFDRVVSAYRLYRALYGIPLAEALAHPASVYKFGDAATRARLRDDPLAPALFRSSIDCRHVYTLIRYSEAQAELASREQRENYDSAFDRLERQSLPVRIVYEWARWQKAGAFPPLSVLGNSYYAEALSRVVTRLDPGRVALVTLAAPQSRARVGQALGTFLGSVARPATLEHLYPSGRWGFEIAPRDIDRARELVTPVFADDTRELMERVGRTPGLDLSLFAPEALFHAA